MGQLCAVPPPTKQQKSTMKLNFSNVPFAAPTRLRVVLCLRVWDVPLASARRPKQPSALVFQNNLPAACVTYNSISAGSWSLPLLRAGTACLLIFSRFVFSFAGCMVSGTLADNVRAVRSSTRLSAGYHTEGQVLPRDWWRTVRRASTRHGRSLAPIIPFQLHCSQKTPHS